MIYQKEEALMLTRKWIRNLPLDIKTQTYSVMLYNSLARCDYIPGVSDIDILAILEKQDAKKNLRSYHKGFCDNNNLAHQWQSHEVAAKKDLYFDLWMFTTDDLPESSKGREGISYFRKLWTHDFIENAVLLFGNDIRNRLHPPPIKEAAHSELKKISQWWDNYYGKITDKELRNEVLYLNVPTFLIYIRSALIALVVSLGYKDWKKTNLIKNLKICAPTLPHGVDAEEAIRFCLQPQIVKDLDLSEIKELIMKYRTLLDEIIEFQEKEV